MIYSNEMERKQNISMYHTLNIRTVNGKSSEGKTIMVGHKIHNLLENFCS